MKKPSEMTVGLFAAVVAVASAMWIDTATAHDRMDEQAASDSADRTAKKKKPRAADVSAGRAAEPHEDLGDNVRETAQEADGKFREGYGGSGDVGKSDGKTDLKDVGRETRNVEQSGKEAAKDADKKFRQGYFDDSSRAGAGDEKSDARDIGRNVRKAEEATKEMGKDVASGVKEADKGFRAGYREEARKQEAMTQDPKSTGSRTDDRAQRRNESGKGGSGTANEPQTQADDRTDMRDIGHELGKSARRLEEAAIEAGRKIRGEAREVEAGFEEGYGGSGAADAGTGKVQVKLKTGADAGTAAEAGDAGTPSKVQVKLKTGADAGTK